MKLYVVRHGASTGNTPGNLIGHSRHPLSERGEAQARAVAARLAPLGPMPVYTSDLPRALETARIIAAEWAGTPPGGAAGVSPAAPADGLLAAPAAAPAAALPNVNPDARLREIDLGDLEGGSWDDFTQNQELTAALEADPFHTPLPGGESLARLRERVIAAVDEIAVAVASGPGPSAAAGPDPSAASGDPDPSAAAAGSDPSAASGDPDPSAAAAAGLDPSAASLDSASSSVCLVAHDGPIRAIVNHYLGVPPEKWWVMTTTHGGLTLLEFSDGWVDLRFLNDTAHLAGVDYDL
jgi:broad specificity phosphatase PhoE